MRHLNDHRKLNVTTKHRRAMLRNLVRGLIEHGSITTTLPKAKEARRFGERCITIGKKAVAAGDAAGKLHYTRLALSEIGDPRIVQQLVDEVAPKYKDRQGGYTRIYKAGFRLGDRSPKAILQLV